MKPVSAAPLAEDTNDYEVQKSFESNCNRYVDNIKASALALHHDLSRLTGTPAILPVTKIIADFPNKLKLNKNRHVVTVGDMGLCSPFVQS